MESDLAKCAPDTKIFFSLLKVLIYLVWCSSERIFRFHQNEKFLEPFEHAKFWLLVGRHPCSKETGTSDFCYITQVSWRIFYYLTILVLLTLGGYIGRFVIEKDMPFYCVAANCTIKACLKDGISLHNIPHFNDEHMES
jgi:hypothetical protein